MPGNQEVLIVHSSDTTRELLRQSLASDDHHVVGTLDSLAGLQTYLDETKVITPTVAIIAHELLFDSTSKIAEIGSLAAKKIRRIYPEIKIVALTSGTVDYANFKYSRLDPEGIGPWLTNLPAWETPSR